MENIEITQAELSQGQAIKAKRVEQNTLKNDRGVEFSCHHGNPLMQLFSDERFHAISHKKMVLLREALNDNPDLIEQYFDWAYANYVEPRSSNVTLTRRGTKKVIAAN